MILRAEARQWKNRCISNLGGSEPEEFLQISIEPTDRLHLQLWIYLPEGKVNNKGYGKNKRTKYPYAKVDTSNFFKLAEDAVAELLGVTCDRQNFTISAHKRVATSSRLVIHVFHEEQSEDPFDPRK